MWNISIFSHPVCVTTKRIPMSCSTSLIVLSLCRVNIDSTRLLNLFHSFYKHSDAIHFFFITIDFSKICRPLGSALFYYSCVTSNITRQMKGHFFIYTDRAKEITLFKEDLRVCMSQSELCPPTESLFFTRSEINLKSLGAAGWHRNVTLMHEYFADEMF